MPDPSPPPFRVTERLHSFGPALRGLAWMLRTQHNARIHAAATVAVLAAGVGFGVTRLEWIALLLAVAIVWAAEALNSAVETVCDVVSPEHDEAIGRAKDVAAGAVLAAAIGAASVGLVVFVPHLLRWLASAA